MRDRKNGFTANATPLTEGLMIRIRELENIVTKLDAALKNSHRTMASMVGGLVWLTHEAGGVLEVKRPDGVRPPEEIHLVSGAVSRDLFRFEIKVRECGYCGEELRQGESVHPSEIGPLCPSCHVARGANA